MWSKFIRWWRWSLMTSTERYLAESHDLADLERRMKRLSQGKSFWPDVSW